MLSGFNWVKLTGLIISIFLIPIACNEANTGSPSIIKEPMLSCKDASLYIGDTLINFPSKRFLEIRFFSEGSILTQDFIPNRTNVEYDSNDIINRTYCG